MHTERDLLIQKLAALKKHVKLKPHQEDAVDVSLNSPTSTSIFAHPTGSGKTVSAIAAIEEYKRLNKGKKTLVIVPAGLKQNFAGRGVRDFTDQSSTVYDSSDDLYANPSNSDYHIMSYELFKKNPERALRVSQAENVILDESHHLKNDTTENFKSIRALRGRVRNAIGMTGSVVSTSGPLDIYNQIDALSGGMHDLGDKKTFNRKFVIHLDHKEKGPVVGIRNREELGSKLRKYVHYVSLKDLAEEGSLPKKVVEEVNVRMTPDQVRLYNNAMDRHRRISTMLQSKYPEKYSNADIAKAYNSLILARQISNSPHVIDPKISLHDAPEKSPKIKRVLDDLQKHLDTTPDAHAVIYSNLIHGGIDALEEGLKQRHVSYGKFIGTGNEGVTNKTRDADVEAYTKGKKKVMLISSAGGEGLSLDDTTLVQMLDPHWNPERILQAEARGIRMGGQAHRPQAERHVDVKRYKSVIPNDFLWMERDEPAIDDLVYNHAWRRDRLNREIRDLLRRDPNAHPSLLDRIRGIGKKD